MASQYPSPYDEEEEDVDFPSERPRRRFAIDLTGMGVRIGATALIIGLSILIIYFAMRPRGEEAATANDIATPPTTSEEQPAASGDPLATFTPGPSSTPPPTDDPTPEPTPEPPSGVLAVGATALVTNTGVNGLNMRTGSGTSFEIAQILQDGTTITLAEGPVEGDGFTWWKIRLEDGTEGWAVQDYLAPQ
ncbi:MAG TPA: SH3 domain-containing protein [Ardenticatenaceae bacterium]|jgi:hypothetical protein